VAVVFGRTAYFNHPPDVGGALGYVVHDDGQIAWLAAFAHGVSPV
jgi:hypothetical protein